MSSRFLSNTGMVLRMAVLGMAGCLGVVAQAQGVIIGKVTRVHDGESVTVRQADDDVVIHLIGLEAPSANNDLSQRSRDSLNACAFGRGVIVTVRGTDRLGRVVGNLESMGRDCGLVQLRSGWARYQPSGTASQPVGDRHAYAAAERNARQSQLGLWARPDTVRESAGGPTASASAPR